MSYELYKIIHFAGILLVFLAFGMAVRAARAGDSGEGRKPIAMGHGIGLFLVLLGGFGMLARLEITGSWPTWVTVKVVVWVLLGGAMVLFKRAAGASRVWGAVVLALGVAAAWAAIMKPGA